MVGGCENGEGGEGGGGRGWEMKSGGGGSCRVGDSGRM